MPGPEETKTPRARYSFAVALLGFVCLVLAIAAVALPLWGYFHNPDGGPTAEKGFFGPWRICKYLLYDRKKCGDGVTRFKPVVSVYYAGLVACAGVSLLFVYCLLSGLQLSMIHKRRKKIFPYSFVVMTKLAISLLTALISIVVASLFALQTDDRENDFLVTRGESFYIQILLIILTFLLFIASLYDVLFSRRLGGDPTMESRDPSGEHATTFNNPGFKERGQTMVSVTDASGRPYLRGGTNGSVATLSTTLSSNGSTVGSITRSPLRSSLKKPRPPGNGLGIQNPGFSGSSPTPSRNGSVKRVRIQTNSTEV